MSGAEVSPHLSWSSMLLFNYGHNSLVRNDSNGNRVNSLVEHHGTAHLLLSLGLLDVLEIGLDVPLIVLQQGSGLPVGLEQASFGIGDVRVVPKLQIFSTRERYDSNGVALALLVDTHLPTGDSTSLQGGDFRIGPRLAFDAVIGGPRLGVNVGYLYRAATQLENLSVRDTISWNAGMEVPLGERFSLTGELMGRVTPGAEEIRSDESPTELLAGGKLRLGGFLATLGGGAGLINGYGTPDFRLFAGLGWASPRPVEEAVVEPTPECTEASLDIDCNEVPPARCEEGVLRTYRAGCAEGECTYTFDESHCADGTLCGEHHGQASCVDAPPECVEHDECNALPAPSCTEGVLTTYAGQCLDGSCEYVANQITCADDMECGREGGIAMCVEKTLVVVDEEAKRIHISEVIHFAFDSSQIDGRSFGLLNQVAKVLQDNLHITHVRIEGHTDNVGRHGYNVRLSQERAAAVRTYLFERGVDANRLNTVGLGPDRPIDTNETDAGRTSNRRVEFHIEVKNN